MDEKEGALLLLRKRKRKGAGSEENVKKKRKGGCIESKNRDASNGCDVSSNSGLRRHDKSKGLSVKKVGSVRDLSQEYSGKSLWLT